MTIPIKGNQLPFEPEPYEQLKARFPKALEKIIDTKQVIAALRGDSKSPVADRVHVFDFDYGLRMIASRQNVGPMLNYVHLSFSRMVKVADDNVDKLAEDAMPIIAKFFRRADVLNIIRLQNSVCFVFEALNPDEQKP